MLKVEKLDKSKRELKTHIRDLATLTASITSGILGQNSEILNKNDPISVIRISLKDPYFRTTVLTEKDICEAAEVAPEWVQSNCSPGLIARVWLDTLGDRCRTPKQTQLRQYYERVLEQCGEGGRLISEGELVVEKNFDRPIGVLEEMPSQKIIESAREALRVDDPVITNPDAQKFLRSMADERALASMKKNKSVRDSMLIQDLSSNRRAVRTEQVIELAKADGLLALPEEKPTNKSTEQMEQIRKLYVFSRPGSFPSVPRIMQDLGLLDKHGQETDEAKITLESVTEHLEIEDWRGQRRDYILRVNDFVEEERLTYDRQVIQRIKGDLENQILVIQRLLMTYWRTGEFRSIDGTIMRHPPSIGDLVSLAETYRRLVEGNALVKQNFYLTKNEQNNSISIAKESPLLGSFIQALRTMTPEQAMIEANKLESIANMLSPQHSEETQHLLNEIELQDA